MDNRINRPVDLRENNGDLLQLVKKIPNNTWEAIIIVTDAG